MPVLVTSSFDDDSIKNEQTSMETPFSHYTSMGKKDQIKNNREKLETSFSPLKVNGDFLLPWKPEF